MISFLSLFSQSYKDLHQKITELRPPVGEQEKSAKNTHDPNGEESLDSPKVQEAPNENQDVFLSHEDMILKLLELYGKRGVKIAIQGIVEIMPDGFGFVRQVKNNFLPSREDVYIEQPMVQEFFLKTGDSLEGFLRIPEDYESYGTLGSIEKINDKDPQDNKYRPVFEQLTPLFPDRKINLDPIDQGGIMGKGKDLTLRVIDMLCPLGFGQRALVVAPPRSGKTIILQTLIRAMMHHHPHVHVMVLMIGERPEEVTEMSRTVKNGEVISSTFDEPCSNQIQVAQMAMERAKRLVESKKDVVLFLDSITRLARAYNTDIPSSGRVLTGGVDASALQKPKRLFGAARNVEQGGSLTIIATTLVETGSKMDEVIFEEFKGTGNAEIVLDRKLAEKRVFPAIDIGKSGTRREELLMEPAMLQKLWLLRRILGAMNANEATDFLLDKMRQSKNNNDFFEMMNK